MTARGRAATLALGEPRLAPPKRWRGFFMRRCPSWAQVSQFERVLVEEPLFVVIGKLRRISARSAFELCDVFEPASLPNAGLGAPLAKHCEHHVI
jgi:hypothetical protein